MKDAVDTDDTLLLREDADGIARLTLNNPAKLNPLSNVMLAALTGELERLAEDRSIRVVVLAAEGKAFCAGHDLKEMTAARSAEDKGRAAFAELFDTCAKMMLAIRALPQPVIAEVHGVAAAAGCQLVATCDMAVASETAKFGVNGVDIGLFCSTPMVALSRNIPRKRAFEMLTTGRFLTAEEALDAGLVNHVTPPDALTARTMELASTVAGKLSAAVKIGKEAFYTQLEMGMADAYAYTGGVMTENMMYRDTAEGISAFIEKRTPDWKDPD